VRVNKIFNFKTLTFKKNNDNNPVIARAVDELGKIKFSQNDILYIKSLGCNPPFENGAQAVDFIKQNNIKINFSKFKLQDVHARWSFDDNTIHINEKYKNLDSFAGILAISEAIFHETGHAKDKDADNSLQEELDCMSLNVLGHRFHKNKYKDIFKGQDSSIFTEGVSLYEKLFFEFDMNKTKLKNRLKEKYGFLKPDSKGHSSSNFARSI